VRLEHAPQQRGVADVAFDPGDFAADERGEPREDRRRAVGEVVEDDRRGACLRQLDDDVRADVSGAAGDQNDGIHPAILRASGSGSPGKLGSEL
jgi:hypothetical protein